MKNNDSIYTHALWLIPALVIYGLLAYHLRFIQDDAYISYRYVANFLGGHGLVYNIGERVEGFTNFGWVIVTAMFGALGLDYISLSRILGLLCGAGVIVMTYLIGREVTGEKDNLPAVLAAYLVAANMSLAYWSPAGLETAAFALAATVSLYWFLRRSRWLVFGLVMAVWLRPEGALVAFLLLVLEAVERRGLPKFSLGCGVIAFILSLPYVVFKVMYYGSILPNPFYAKTGWDIEQLRSGLEYAGRYFAHYGFYGAGLVIPLVFFKRLSVAARAVWLFVVLYIAYIALVGGDVLKVHRFFLPLFAGGAVMTALSVRLVVAKLAHKTRVMVLVIAAVPLLALTYVLPKSFVETYNRREKAFTGTMGDLADQMKASDSTDFSIAVTTIGRLGYGLLGHDVIDMLGLTDSTIARHPEAPIPGMATTWKERAHNSKYLLERAPDYIIFSTGYKPSAPAEKTLMLYRQFLDDYRAVAWVLRMSEDDHNGTLNPAFHRVRPITGELKPVMPLEFVDEYKIGLEDMTAGRWVEAQKHFDRALSVSKPPYYPYLVYSKAFTHMMRQQHDIAEPIFNHLIATDSTIFEAHQYLWLYALMEGNTAKAEIHARWIKKLVPWYYDRARGIVERLAKSSQVRSR